MYQCSPVLEPVNGAAILWVVLYLAAAEGLKAYTGRGKKTGSSESFAQVVMTPLVGSGPYAHTTRIDWGKTYVLLRCRRVDP